MMKQKARDRLARKGVMHVGRLSNRMLQMVGGWNPYVPLIYRPNDRPFWNRFILEHGPAKSSPTAGPVDESLLANFVEPFVRKLLVNHKEAKQIHAEELAKCEATHWNSEVPPSK